MAGEHKFQLCNDTSEKGKIPTPKEWEMKAN